MEPRGRGRAALFAQASKPAHPAEPVPIGRGRAINPSSISSEEAKPKGRGALFRQFTASAASSSTSQGDADRETDVSVATFESGTTLSGLSSSGSDGTQKKGMGRAALFGSVSTSPSSSEVTRSLQQMKLEETPKAKSKEIFSGPSPETKEPVQMHGQQGKKVEATANYFRLEYTNMNQGVNEYEVTFDPAVDSSRERAFVINQHFRNFGGKIKVFDGGWRLFTPDTLNNEVNVAEVTLRTGMTVKMTMKFKRVKKFGECESLLNIIFKRIMGELQLVKFGRSDYNPKEAIHIAEYKLSIWPGCITVVSEYEGGILLCCDASHRVLRNQSCLEIIMDIMRTRGAQSRDIKDEILNAFMGVSVITDYNKQIKRVDDIDFESNPTKTFSRGGSEISFIEYYKMQYGINIKDHKQPMIVSRARRKEKGKEKEDILLYLVPELCYPTGLTDQMRDNFRLMKAVAEYTRVSPTERQAALMKFIKGIKNNQKARQHLLDWNLDLPEKTVDLIARVVEPEKIIFGGNKSIIEVNSDWGRAAANNRMLSTVDLRKWAIIYYNKNERQVGEFVDCFRSVIGKIGLEADKPKTIPLNSDNTRAYCEEIRKLASKSPQILVIVFPTQRDDRYAAVKKLCNSELGIATQVIQFRTINNQKNLKSIVTKIVLQMNCKVGGALWGVTIPFKEEGIMFCGIDAYHDPTRKGQSVVALVTSTNQTCTRWASSTSLHNRGQEISDVITGLLKDNLQIWHKTNQTFPSRIVMYRDGVGDGQLGVVRDFEVPQFYKLFMKIKTDYKPKLTYVVVQKRINTRIYTRDGQRQFGNPPPGSIIDHTITRRDWYDYFLISQNVRQGTVSPTHYVVVHDESDLSVDMVQKLSYKMTHLYYNWNGTVRVPAPCQYAHKLAYLVGQHMHAPATENLRNVLFFL